MYVNRVALYVTAHAHILGALLSQRTECFSEQVRLLFVVNIRRFKTLVSEQFRIIWLAYQGTDPTGYCLTEKCTKRVSFPEVVDNWVGRITKLIESDLKTFKSVLETWRPPMPEESHFYSHEPDGRFTTIEMLRRATFNEWFVDTGMLQAALRFDVFPVGATVGDMGAGTGEYARWLNDTGLVTAYAFDGSQDIELLTKKKVTYVNLVTNVRKDLKYDWIMLMEVLEHIPSELHGIFFQNINTFAKDGILMSWAPPQYPPIGHTNPLEESEVFKVIFQHLPDFVIDHDSSAILRAKSKVGWVKNSLHVLRRRDDTLVDISAMNERCSGAKHLVMSGQEDRVAENTETAGECCDQCTSSPDCRFWTWGSLNKICRLLKTKEYEIEQKGFVSGGSQTYFEERVEEERKRAETASLQIEADGSAQPPPQ